MNQQPEIPPDVIERYLKIAKLAEEGEAGEKTAAAKIRAKLETKHPGIAEVAMRHAEQARMRETIKEAGYTVNPDDFFGQFLNQAMHLQSEGMPADAGFMERMMWRMMDWSLNQLTNLENDTIDTKRRRRRMSLKDQLAAEIDKQEGEVYLSESGRGRKKKTYVEINVAIPMDLWRKVTRSKTAGKHLVDVLQSMLDQLEDEDEEYDEEEESPESPDDLFDDAEDLDYAEDD